MIHGADTIVSAPIEIVARFCFAQGWLHAMYPSILTVSSSDHGGCVQVVLGWGNLRLVGTYCRS